MDFYCVDPLTGRRGLLIEATSAVGKVSDEAVKAYSQRLFESSIRVGMIATPTEFVIVRDALSSMKLAKNELRVERVPTAPLFMKARLGTPSSGRAFEAQVRRWIEAVGASWFEALPPDAVAKMVPDVVGNMSGALIEESVGIEARDVV